MYCSRILRAAGVILATLPILLLFNNQGWADSHVYEVVKPATLVPGDAIPAPKGKVILNVIGAPKAGAGGKIAFDRATLESLGMVKFTSKNKWMSAPATYEGVLGSALLDAVGVPKGMNTMRMVAINDYVVHIPVADFRKWPVILAIKMDGKYMTVRNKGPIWVVYPNHVYKKLGSPAYQDRWIWQLKEISFE